MTIPLEFSDSLSEVTPAQDGGGLQQTELGLVASVNARIAKITNATARLQRGTPGVPLQRFDIRKARTQSKANGCHPGKRAEVLNAGVRLANRERALIPVAQELVIHLQVRTVNRKVQRDFSISPKQLSVMYRQVVDGERKQLLDTRVYRRGLHSQGRYVGGNAILRNRDVNHGMIQDQRRKAKLGAKKRNHLHLREQAIGMHEWDVGRTFFAMHRDIANFDLEMEGNNMKSADFGPSAGDSFDLFDHSSAHVSLEGFCGGVPECGQRGDCNNPGGDQKVFPPAAGSGGGLVHRVCTPPSRDSVTPARLTLLSERRDCSQETISSLTFS